jgi:hypothetical protein
MQYIVNHSEGLNSMSPRMANQFFDTLTVLDVLAQSPDGMTVGEIQKTMPAITVGQVKRMVHSLDMCKMVYVEKQPHGRTGKFVWRMTEGAAILLSSIARNYSEKN